MIDLDTEKFHIIELYSGEQRLAKLAKGLGLTTAAMDKMYDVGDNKKTNNAMDMNTSAGFVFLGSCKHYPSTINLLVLGYEKMLS